ncbi:unnamed protein product, partial [Owenia fusiformis]
MASSNSKQTKIGSFLVEEKENGRHSKNDDDMAKPRASKRRLAGSSSSKFSIPEGSDSEDFLSESEYDTFADSNEIDSSGQPTKKWIVKLFQKTLLQHEDEMSKRISKTVNKAVTRALQSTQTRVTKLEEENATLKVTVSSLEKRIDQIT